MIYEPTNEVMLFLIANLTTGIKQWGRSFLVILWTLNEPYICGRHHRWRHQLPTNAGDSTIEVLIELITKPTSVTGRYCNQRFIHSFLRPFLPVTMFFLP